MYLTHMRLCHCKVVNYNGRSLFMMEKRLHSGNVDQYWLPLSAAEKEFWSEKAVKLNLEVKADREVADAKLLDETLAANHLGSRDARIFVDVKDSVAYSMERRCDLCVAQFLFPLVSE